MPEQKMNALGICPESCSGLLHAIAVSVLRGEISMHCTGAKCQLENKSDYKPTLVRYLCVSIIFTQVPQPKQEVSRGSALSVRRCSLFSAGM